MTRDENRQQREDGPTTITSNSKVSLGFLSTLIAILGPVVTLLVRLYNGQMEFNRKLDDIARDIQVMRMQIGDRWTRSMMILFSTELELKNRHQTNPIYVPNPEEIAKRLPVDYSSQTHPDRDSSR